MGATGCGGPDLPDTSSPVYAEAVAAFYRGVAAAQVGESGLAAAAFGRVTELVPREPAGWANLGLIALQRRDLEDAADRLEEARALAPDDARIAFLSALVEQELGHADAAAAHLRRAVELDPQHLRALSLLAQTTEEENRDQSAAEAGRLMDRLLAVQPRNLVVLVERGRLAAKAGDIETLRQTLDRIGAVADSLSLPLDAELLAVRAAAESGAFDRAAAEIAFVQTALQPLPRYTDDQDAVRASPSRADVLLTSFVRLPTPPAQSAPADTALRFAPETLVVAEEGPVSWVRAEWLSEEIPLALIAAGRGMAWVSIDRGQVEAFAVPGGATAGPLPPAAVAPLDYDYDFRIDLALAGPGGLRLLRQDETGSFEDVTREAIPAAVARTASAGAWAADLDMEGDLDLVIARVEGAPMVLRNRGDGTFDAYAEFTTVSRLRDFAWADLDADGDPDAALLDAAGRVYVFLNSRNPTSPFRPHPLPDTLGSILGIAVADFNHDAVLDLILLQADGALLRLSLDRTGAWDVEVAARWTDMPPAGPATAQLMVVDLDNNGDLDLVASTPESARAWLRTASGFRPLPPIDAAITGVADVTGESRLDLIGVSRDGQSRLFVNEGTRDYYSTTIRPRAAQATGDRRINSFGVGGEIEVRAGLVYQKRVIHGAAVHFGLGEHQLVDVARIIWPNGSVQAEFNLAATNETILTRQRLKGSCPWVFTFDGAEMQFVTDFLWRTALGLRINAQGEAAVIHSEDWIKIRGDQLAPRDGFYDVRITAELWETHFFDHVALMVVDHPVGTEVFVDERFALPAPEPAVYALGPLQAVAGAWDHAGRDVTSQLSARDERFLDTFALGDYQGIAAEHYVEIALGDDAPLEGPLWLVASGWVYPTDASINVAVSQGNRARPRGLQLDVPDGLGGWVTVEENLGFPAGKTKTMLIDLAGVFQPGAPRRVRLRTNMEVYWDRIAWAVGQPDAPVTTRRVLPTTAELRYRGFSEVVQAVRTAPELPDYGRIATAVPQWRDLVGFHTRFGDVLDTIRDTGEIGNADRLREAIQSYVETFQAEQAEG